MNSFEQQVFWITGASSGIGEACAYALSKINAKIIISARRGEELERVKDNCHRSDLVKVLTLDLSDSDSLKAKAKEAEGLFGQVDVLINNGGISQRDYAINTSMHVDRQLMEVNYFGSIALSKYLLPAMVERKSGHHVVITSAVGIISTPNRSSYSASKHALHGFYDALRAEHHNDHIKVTIVCPGFVNTNISFNSLMGDGTKQNKLDKAQANGLSPEYTAKRIVSAIRKQKQEVYVGGAKEVFGIYLKRFFPTLFAMAVRKMSVT